MINNEASLTTALDAFHQAGRAMHGITREQDVTDVLERLNRVVRPIIQASGNRELNRVSDDITNKLAGARHLNGYELAEAQVDICNLFYRILELLNEQQALEKLTRQGNRDLSWKYSNNVASNHEGQGDFLLNSAIGSGIMAILSGLCPILQNSSAGQALHSALPSKLTGGAIQKDFFNGLGKMMYAGSRIADDTGRVRTAYAESSRTRDQFQSELSKDLARDNTSEAEDIRSNRGTVLNGLREKSQGDREINAQLCK